jgi:hypothetical protein
MEVKLTNTDSVVLIDDCDLEEVFKFKWSCDGKYAVRYISYRKEDGSIKKGKIYMHRAILNAGPSDIVDHRDFNTMDNRRSNIRVCDKSQNSTNRIKKKKKDGSNYSSKYKGVYFSNKDQRWVAHAKLNGRHKFIGQRKTELEAAELYNKYAAEVYGEFALLNDV